MKKPCIYALSSGDPMRWARPEGVWGGGGRSGTKQKQNSIMLSEDFKGE